uniref:Uncharacterized protein n=1 Tax=Tanacetum cinerariifolium TaxID=118510 RepID=A0A699V8B2_TANCI|nr:hypothetical protein [Tanacetum cinerariifolium]
MIQGNVMSYEPKSMQKAIESENDQMDQKLLGIVDRQADNKRKEPQWHIKEFLLALSVELRVITREITRGWETEIRGIKIRLGMKMWWQKHMDWVLQEETQTLMS